MGLISTKLKEGEVIGLYGCYCHPFKNWAEHEKYNKQKIVFGEKYINRCTGKECIAKNAMPDNKHFIEVFEEPYDCPRCNTFHHVSNLIKKVQHQLSFSFK